MSQGVSTDKVEEELARSILFLEKELGVYIDENYPLTKFFSQLDNTKWYYKQKKAAERGKGKKTLR